MEPLPRRPWYLLVAIVVAWLFGVGGCTEGTQIIGGYWSPAPDPTELAADAPTEQERAHLKEAGTRCLVATDNAKGRIFPLGVASFLLGAAIVVFAARAMAGRKSARALLVQLVLVQALFVGVAEFATRDVKRECAEVTLARMRMNLDPAQKEKVLDRIPPEMLTMGLIVGFALRTTVAALVVLSLTRSRTLAWFDAIERRRLEGP